MAVTATGILALPMANLAALLASSASFRTLVGAGSAAAALAFIYYPEADDTSDTVQTRPRAIVSLPQEFASKKTAVSSWHRTGALWLSVELAPASQYLGVIQDEAISVLNTLGAIQAEMEANAGNDTYLNVLDFTVVQGPGPVITTNEGNAYFWAITWLCSWGGR